MTPAELFISSMLREADLRSCFARRNLFLPSQNLFGLSLKERHYPQQQQQVINRPWTAFDSSPIFPLLPFRSTLPNANNPLRSRSCIPRPKTKIVDEDLRQSVFRAITDPKLMDLVDANIVSHLNQTDQSYQYTLCRNDITHIKYEEGGFFQRHKDYLSLTSNLIEEFTLLVCVTTTPSSSSGDAREGGETTIHGFGGTSQTFATATPGSGLLFRKDLEHEGCVLKKGTKHILTANLWAIRKQQSSHVLLVTFPNTNVTKAVSPMERAANASSSYVLPVDNLTGMLKAHVEWANRAAEREGKDPLAVVTYECQDFSHEAFGVVVKIFNRCYVDEEAIGEHKECLGYFGPFEAHNLLVNLAVLGDQHNKNDDSSPSARSTRKHRMTIPLIQMSPGLRIKSRRRNLCSRDPHDGGGLPRGRLRQYFLIEHLAKADPRQLLSGEPFLLDRKDYLNIGLGLKVAFNYTNHDMKARVLNELLGEPGKRPGCVWSWEDNVKYLPGVSPRSPDGGLFHRDSKGKIAFTSKQAEAASDFISSLELDECVKASLQKKRFELPQHQGNVNANFCNEALYGKLNILWVCGALRLEDKKVAAKKEGEKTKEGEHTKESAPNVTEFDAWPPRWQKLESEYTKKWIDNHSGDYRDY
ncbi:expressed unknown protein [Seminavis robusta]|uniref:Prolyl 4-hydroxylase alpha subunit domain-containing protein n=1 Tax=Seminavis robusta TaxID=568900 RepID=A0A9N8EIJ9_9STRA|nr:expressed unknown protein [Seminavis robusta]|eukprot:Sro1056_g236220.1 n/a (642) ;mRNA; r:34786-36902